MKFEHSYRHPHHERLGLEDLYQSRSLVPSGYERSYLSLGGSLPSFTLQLHAHTTKSFKILAGGATGREPTGGNKGSRTNSSKLQIYIFRCPKLLETLFDLKKHKQHTTRRPQSHTTTIVDFPKLQGATRQRMKACYFFLFLFLLD